MIVPTLKNLNTFKFFNQGYIIRVPNLRNNFKCSYFFRRYVLSVIPSCMRFIYYRQVTQWRNDHPCYPCHAGGRHLRGAAYYRIYWFLNSKMDHISANIAIGRREKNIWGYKKLQGGKKPIRKTEKKVATFFFLFFFWRQ